MREARVVDHDVSQRLRVRLTNVEELGGEISLSVEPSGIRIVPTPVALRSSPFSQHRVNVEPDAEVPMIIDFRSECKNPVDDQDGVLWGFRHNGGVIDLR